MGLCMNDLLRASGWRLARYGLAELRLRTQFLPVITRYPRCVALCMRSEAIDVSRLCHHYTPSKCANCITSRKRVAVARVKGKARRQSLCLISKWWDFYTLKSLILIAII
jgi:hypothetical protein